MGLKKCVWIVLGIVLMASRLQAADIAELRLSQVCQHLPELMVYLHIQDENGNFVTDLQEATMTAFVGSEPVPVKELVPFDPDREGAAYIFLVDISKSLSSSQFGSIREALAEWVDHLTEKDRAAVMTLGSTVRLVQDFTVDKAALKATINGLALTDMDTQLHLGLVKAMELGRRNDAGLPDRRVIITLSDGHDDFAGGMTRAEVLEQMKQDPVPIYAIGFCRAPMTPEKESYLKILGEFARTSGGVYFRAGDTPLAEIYAKVRQKVRHVWEAKLGCTACRADGGVYRLQMNLTAGPRTLSDGLNIRLLPILPAAAAPETPTETPEQTRAEEPSGATVETPGQATPEAGIEPEASVPSPPPLPIWKKVPLWGYAAGGVLLLLLLLLALLRKKKTSPEISPLVADVASPGDPDTQGAKPTGIPGDPEPPPTPLPVRFSVVGSGQGRTYEREIIHELIIGRNPACDLVVLEDDEISGRHCKLVRKDDSLYLLDLDSTNGTLVNGAPFTGMYRIRTGDLILLGRTELRVSF